MTNAEIIERLEKLDGPDREVDAYLWAYLDGRSTREDRSLVLARNSRPPHDECILGTIAPGKHSRNFNCEGYHHPPIPAYTASLDAAVALVEKLGFHWLKKLAFPPVMTVVRPLTPEQDERKEWARHFEAIHPATPAIALLIALFKAREGRDG